MAKLEDQKIFISLIDSGDPSILRDCSTHSTVHVHIRL